MKYKRYILYIRRMRHKFIQKMRLQNCAKYETDWHVVQQ